jgi:hypothetical protein
MSVLFYIILLLIVSFDPQNKFGFRMPLLAFFMIIWIIYIPKAINITSNTKTSAFLFVYTLPLWGLLVYIFRGDGSFVITDTSYISTGIMGSLVYLMNKSNSEDSFNSAMTFISVLFIILFLAVGFELYGNESRELINFLISSDVARIDFREYAGLKLPYIYIYTSTLLIIPLVIWAEKTNKILSFDFIFFISIALCLIISGTRSHILIGALYILKVLAKNNKPFFIGAAFLIGIFFLSSIIQILLEMLNPTEGSNSYKLSMFGQYATILNDYKTILFGQGFQAINWDFDLKQITDIENGATKTELTFVELFRVFGFPLTLLFIFSIFAVLTGKEISSSKKQILFLLCVDSALNPHMFSTYGAVIFAYAMCNSVKKTT